MNLRIQYNGQFIRLQPGSAIELDRNSPLFLSDDSILADYSLPVTVLYDEPNARLLGDVFFDYGIKSKLKIEVNVFDGATYKFRAIMVINKNKTNRILPGKGNVEGYLLTGASYFFNPIKDKKLCEMELGGPRSFDFTTWDAADGSGGFWQHIHETWTGNFDYVFAPVRNESWVEDDYYAGWINQLGPGGVFDAQYANCAQMLPSSWPVAMPRTMRVLRLIFAELGWTLDTTGLNDAYCEKLLLLNLNPIKTTYETGVVDGVPTIGFLPKVQIYLNKCISPEVTVSNFILSLCRRYGWGPVFDSETKTCSLIALKEVAATGRRTKDFTRYAGASTTTDFSGDIKRFSFKNSFPSSDSLISAPDFTNFVFETPVFKKSDLPIPSANYDNSLIFCFYENAWFHITFDEDTSARVWEKFSDNIYDDEAKNNSDTFDTDCSTLPIMLSSHRQDNLGVDYYGLFPACNQARNSEWGIRTLIYHGMVSEIKADGTAGPRVYPYASSTIVMPDGTVADGWSNVYRHANGSKQYGIIDYWFKAWLRIIRVNTPVVKNLYLPLHELEALRWDDEINILNQSYFLQRYLEPVPYRGVIEATLLPLVMNEAELIASTPDAGGYTIYLKFIWEDEQDAADVYLYGALYWTQVRKAKPIVRAYADPGGLVPVAVTNLKIYIGQVFKAAGVIYFESSYSTVISGSSYNLAKNELQNISYPTIPWPPHVDDLYFKTFVDKDGQPVEHFYTLKPSADYVVI